MHWTDEVIEQLAALPMPDAGRFGGGGTHVINDSKTPSGRAHVGSLRGVLIHDAMFRVMKAKGIPVTYTFGCDDYDPVDELPHGMKEHFQQFLGQPLCNTPAPPGSAASDMADHFIKDFWSVFADLGVECTFYRMRDIYRAGTFNAPIDRILAHAHIVRDIYKKVSNAERPAHWIPFQVICENCGRIGTTECSNYDGSTVEYVCKPDLVTWAKGCGHRGKMSPFDGRGKLPWKLEWVAKWATFPVTIEGAGEDHNTKGGSRDVAAQCLKAIYNREPPQNIPYGFILIGGAKMSSSKGLGVAARQVADFLPPEILRFLMIRTRPKSQANFDPTEDALVKLFNEFDRSHLKSFSDPKYPPYEKTNYLLSEVPGEGTGPFFDAEFQLVLALVQMPHLDIVEQFQRIKGAPLTDIERRHLDKRIHAARYFIEHLAAPEERLTLQTTPPPAAAELSAVQRAFLRELATHLGTCPWNGEAIQAAVFDAARLTPIDQPTAFLAFYRVLLNNTKGPKAGNFLAFLKREDVVRLFSAVPWNAATDAIEAVRASAVTVDQVRELAQGAKSRAIHATTSLETLADVQYVEAKLSMDDGKTHVRRVLAPGGVGGGGADTLKAVRAVLPVQIA